MPERSRSTELEFLLRDMPPDDLWGPWPVFSPADFMVKE